ncbi:MAG TPA: transcriptional regulator [Mycobacteriales bacterium]|nr:transcriptional regulator [Mycobacteriales bacterium]
MNEGGKEPYSTSLGRRLRAIRVQQGLSLHGVEVKSGGRWKGVVIGSYERGSRAITVQRLAELADFYGVPVAELLPGGTTAATVRLDVTPRLVLDLVRLQQLGAEAAPLARYAAALQAQRGDYHGRIMSIRSEDLRSLAIIFDDTPSNLAERLISWGVLNAAQPLPVLQS